MRICLLFDVNNFKLLFADWFLLYNLGLKFLDVKSLLCTFPMWLYSFRYHADLLKTLFVVNQSGQISVEKAYAAYTTAVANDGFNCIPFNVFGRVLKGLFNDDIVKKRRKLDKENNGGRTC